MNTSLTTLSLSFGLCASAFGQVQAVHQYDYLDPLTGEVVQSNSRVCKIDIDFDSSDPGQLQLLEENGGGYLNIFLRLDPIMEPDWVVENDVEFFVDVEELDGHQHSYVVGLTDLFNGPDAWDLETIEVASSVTAEPLLFQPDDLDWDLRFVETAEWRYGNGSLLSPDDIPIDNPISRETATAFLGGAKGTPVKSGRTFVTPKQFPIVAEALDECLPASHARSLAYLALIYSPFTIGAGGIQQLHNDLTHHCDTNDSRNDVAPNAPHHGGGTYLGGPGLNGRREVNSNRMSADRNWRIESTEEDVLDLSSVDRKNKLDAVIDKLNRGIDVEFDWTFPHPIWQWSGGHTVTVLKLIKYERQNGDGTVSTNYRLDYLQDDQGTAGAQRDIQRLWINENGIIRYNGSPAGQVDAKLRTISTDRYLIHEDINGDGEVNGADLGLLMAGFGFGGSSGDIDGDGDVDGADLGRLLGKWGPVYPDLP